MENSLKEALRYRGCPVCRLLDKDEYDFMCHLQYQAIHDEKARKDLVIANGYCNFHFYEMARLTSPRGIAMVTRELIDREIKELQEGSLPSRERIDCPMCGHLAEREDFYLREFRDLLREEILRKDYGEADGLCRVHLQKILHFLKESELGQFLLLAQVQHLKNLRTELETFLEKGKANAKGMGPEKNAWWFAIQKKVGKKGLWQNDSFWVEMK
jgi:hypothetical protein